MEASQALDILVGVNVMNGSIRNYSTSIAAAWEVVEHMHSMRYHLMLWFDDMTGPEPHWSARFPRFLTGRDETFSADTAPRAICLAALGALQVPARRQ